MLLSQCVQDELDRLATLPFSFDMNNPESSKSSSGATESGSQTRRQTGSADSTDPTDSPSSIPIAPGNNPLTVNYSTLDPFTLMNTPNNVLFPGQLSNSPHTVNPPVMPGNNSFAYFPTTQTLHPQYQQQLMMWPFIPQQPFASNVPTAGGPSAFVNSQPPMHSYPPAAAAPSRPMLQHISPGSPASQIHSPTSSTHEQSPIDPEDAGVVEDKRRRNTAASARFRIKKKQKNLNLERTVSDLTSRAKELEREATNLRRENSWLKEMVMMKGRRNLLGSGRYHEEVSSDSEGDGRDDDAEESSDNDHVQRKKSKAKMKGKSKTNTDDNGNGKFKGKGK